MQAQLLGLRVSDDDDDDEEEDLRLASRFRGEEGHLPTYLTYVFRLGVWQLSLLQVSVLSCYRRQVGLRGLAPPLSLYLPRQWIALRLGHK